MKKMPITLLVALVLTFQFYAVSQDSNAGLQSSIISERISNGEKITRVSSTPLEQKSDIQALYRFWLNELDSLGVIHNNALDYAFQRIRSMGVSSLTNAAVAELTATLTAEFFTNRYGGTYGFSEQDLKNEILDMGITPLPPASLNISEDLRGTINTILITLNDLKSTESSSDFATKVAAISGPSLTSFTANEQMYLRGYADVISKSLDYWDRNAPAWAGLSGSSSVAQKEKFQHSLKQSFMEEGYGTNYYVPELVLENDIDFVKFGNDELIIDVQKRHPCATAIASADGGGLLSGVVRGCITGALFGAGVGCIPAAIFWGGVQAVTSSLGAGITCLMLN